MKPSLILINPWIYDFAAFDLWSKPLGLLQLAAYLKQSDFHIHLIDCLDVHHPGMKAGPAMKRPRRDPYGAGKFWKETIPKPEPLRNISRPYSRYGISPSLFEQELRRCGKPSAILITSLMTYWYPGVRDAVRIAKEVYPHVPVILGGVYATLCHQHAVNCSGADRVISGDGMAAILKVLDEYGIPVPTDNPNPGARLRPAFDLLSKNNYICIMTSSGCPYRCKYCASHRLNPQFLQRDPDEALDEILYWHKAFGIRDFAFYDDALLMASRTHLGVLLEKLAGLDLNLRFHTPNAMHVKNVTPDISKLMYQTGFRTIRLGVEALDMAFHRDLDNKMEEGDFERAVHSLRAAGFTSQQIGAYILIGLPGQSIESIEETITMVGSAGALPYPSEYSPIPFTALWEKAIAFSKYDLANEPLFHNNTLFPCWSDSMKQKAVTLKRAASEIRRTLLPGASILHRSKK